MIRFLLISLPRWIAPTARPILLHRLCERNRILTTPQRTTTAEMILFASPCDIDGHILQLLRLRRFRGLHQYGSTTALVTAIIVNLYAEHRPDGTMVTHSKVRGFVIVAKVRFVEPINPISYSDIL